MILVVDNDQKVRYTYKGYQNIIIMQYDKYIKYTLYNIHRYLV